MEQDRDDLVTARAMEDKATRLLAILEITVEQLSDFASALRIEADEARESTDKKDKS